MLKIKLSKENILLNKIEILNRKNKLKNMKHTKTEDTN